MENIKNTKHDNRSDLTEQMTVQEIKHRYPSTIGVFKALILGRGFRFAGYDCLDEVAWHNGMGSQTLLDLLSESVFCIAQKSMK
jgi:hypothetical protein